MSLDLRVLLADAYHAAALQGSDMAVAMRALEAIRSAASGPDVAFAALDEVQRQTGLTRDAALVPALVALRQALEAARIVDDVGAIRAALAADPDRGWAEMRRRLARALAEFNDEIGNGIVKADLPLLAERQAAVSRWIEQMRFARHGKWDRVLDLFESFGQDPEVDPADRARFLARVSQIHIYYTNDAGAARHALEQARELADRPGTPRAVHAEVTSAAGQYEIQKGDRAVGKRLLQDAIEIDPRFEDSYKWLGDAFIDDPGAGAPDLQEAEKWFNLGIENAPGGSLNVTALARLLGKPDHYRARRLRVADLKHHALRVTPRHRYDVYTTFAQIAIDNGELDEATRLAMLAIGEDESRPDAWILAARIKILNHDQIGGVADYGRAFAAEPETFGVWNEVANAVRSPESRALAEELLEALGIAFAEAPVERIVPLRISLFQAMEEWDSAEAESQRAFAQDGSETAHQRRVALIRNDRANRSYDEGDYGAAELWYTRALDATPDDAVIWGNLALALEHQTDGDVVERLGRTVEALEHAIAQGGPDPDPEYIKKRAGLRARHRLAARYGARVLDYPVAPQPIGLDVGPILLDRVVAAGSTSLSETCLAAIDRVRRRVSAETGLALPGINFRHWTMAPEPGDYLTLLGGLSVTQSRVPADRYLVFGAVAGGLPAESPPVADPLSGAIGFWVPESFLARVEANATVWTVLDFALHDLARVFLRNVRTELSLDDVARLLESAGVPDIDAGNDASGVLHRVTQVVRALVAEGAPVNALDRIAGLVRDAPPERAVADLIEDARMLPGVRERLRGNDPASRLLQLGPGLSQMVRNAIWRGDREPVLALLPDDCQEFIARVRWAPGRPEDHALLVDDDLRPFVRWVLELEFPDMPVLARSELMSARPADLVIDLEQAHAGVTS